MKDQGRSKRKRTGGRRKLSRNKKRYQLGREPAATMVGEPRFQIIDSRGNNEKLRALSTNIAQVVDGADVAQADIEGVIDNSPNVSYARRNIITRGSIIDTNVGRVCVTSRPGQDGQVNAVVVDDE